MSVRAQPTPVAPPVSTVRHRREALWRGLVPAWLALLGLVVFLPGLRTPFVSDTFIYLESARASSFSTILSRFVPSATSWYRPTTDLVFWLEYQAFGLNPLGYHLVALGCHLGSALLIQAIALHLTASRPAAVLASSAFLVTIHAHEVVYDIADLHLALSGVALLATLLAYMRGMPIVALLLTTLTMSIDEAGVLVLPLLGLYEAICRIRRAPEQAVGHELGATARRVLPFAALTAGYFAFRLLAAPGGFYNETTPCRSGACIVTGVLAYVTRLFARPEGAIASLGPSIGFAALSTRLIIFAALLLLPWPWRRWRAIAFATGWVAGSILYFVLALWGYIADRFLYIPDMGLALLIGGVGAEARDRWPAGSRVARVGTVCVAAVLFIWLGTGAEMLRRRGQLWDRAGREASAIVESTYRLVPEPPGNAMFIFSDVPDSYSPSIPPGNTGPYLFRNGLDAALRIRYGRADIQALVFRDSTRRALDGPPGTIFLIVSGDEVLPAAPP